MSLGYKCATITPQQVNHVTGIFFNYKKNFLVFFLQTHAMHVVHGIKERNVTVILYTQNKRETKRLKIWGNMGLSDGKVYGCWGVGGLASRGSTHMAHEQTVMLTSFPLV